MHNETMNIPISHMSLCLFNKGPSHRHMFVYSVRFKHILIFQTPDCSTSLTCGTPLLASHIADALIIGFKSQLPEFTVIFTLIYTNYNVEHLPAEQKESNHLVWI